MFLQGHPGLEQDNSGPFRVYRDNKGKCFHSVTHILKETSDSEALERWKNRVGEQHAGVLSNVASVRGTRAHSRVEWRLKTARKLAIHAANIRGLERVPASIWKWALTKVYKAKPPKLDLSSVGYGKSLDGWLKQHCVGEAGIELRVTCSPQYACTKVAGCDGWAGTFDAALYLQDRPGLWLCDWKTSATRRSVEFLDDYFDQLGAYHSAIIQHNPDWEFAGGVIVIARRAGPPDVHWLTNDMLLERSHIFHGRFLRYLDQRLNAPKSAFMTEEQDLYDI
jgi:hypothetical protein